MTPSEAINILIKESKVETNSISDGYHTFAELYEHRITLFIALGKALHENMKFRQTIWKSRKHSDGSEWAGWFIMGFGTIKGTQITYHIPILKWDECWFANERDLSPDFDGHTSADVLERLKQL